MFTRNKSPNFLSGFQNQSFKSFKLPNVQSDCLELVKAKMNPRLVKDLIIN